MTYKPLLQKFLGNNSTLYSATPNTPTVKIPVNSGVGGGQYTPSSTPVISSAGATGTKPTNITPPQKSNLPPAGKAFVQAQVSSNSPNFPSQTSSTQGNPDTGSKTDSPTPETPQAPSTPSATDTAFSEYIRSLQPSAGVTNAKTAYNDFIANQSKSIAGLEGQGRGIPLSIVRGEQEKLKNQTDPEATRLQNAIGIAQDSATAISNANKAKYDYEVGKKTEAKTATTDTKPFDVGDHTYAFNPITGKYEDQGINTKTTASSEGFTLSPGEVRFDANGKQIASGGAKPQTQAQETAQIAKTEKETAAQQSASQSIGIVNNLLSGDRYKSISGATQTGSIPFFGDRTAVNEYDQLQGLLKLGVRSLLKGQGAVSDYEGKILGQAASSLSRLTSEGEMKKALQKVRGVLKTNNGQTTTVNVTNPKTGETIKGADLSGAEIYHLISEGNTIDYQ